MKIEVKVICNAAKSEIVLQEGNFYKIRLHALAEKGKANLELIRFLSEHFKVPQSQIVILKGRTASRKIVEILA